MYDAALDTAHLLSDDAVRYFWHAQLASLPHGRLLDRPAGITKDAHSVTLVHATEHLDSIVASKTLSTTPGCLLSCVYTVPGYENNGSVILHNYGVVVFRHKDPSTIIERVAIAVSSDKALDIKPFSYLSLGEYYDLLVKSLTTEYSHNIKQAIAAVEELLTPRVREVFAIVREQYKEKHLITSYDEAIAFLTLMHEIAKQLPIISFGYFEAVSQCLMLMSEDETTLAYKEKGQLHNLLYVHLLHEFAARYMDRFDASLFNPSVAELLEIVREGTEKGIYAIDETAFIISSANQLIALIGGQIATTIDSLRGHSLYLFLYKKDPAITETLKEKTDTIIADYWKKGHIGLVYNAATIKGEVGITSCFPSKHHYTISRLTSTDSEQEFSIGATIEVTIKGATS